MTMTRMRSIPARAMCHLMCTATHRQNHAPRASALMSSTTIPRRFKSYSSTIAETVSSTDLSPSLSSSEHTENSGYCITFEDILDAERRLAGYIHRTPLLSSASINAEYAGVGQNLFFKVEAMQRTGSFKYRGAMNAIQCLIDEYAGRTQHLSVVAHSSGNHAQALACAAQVASNQPLAESNGSRSSTTRLKINATIVTPNDLPDIKQAAIRTYGGMIDMLPTNSFEERKVAVDQIVSQTSGPVEVVHSSQNSHVIAGQGTVCLEMIQQLQQQEQRSFDAVIVPVSGGGLVAGSTVALRAVLGDDVKIIVAEPEVLDDTKRSFQDGFVHKTHPTNPELRSVADGLKSTLGPLTWPIVRDLVDDVITVSENEIVHATKLIWERLKIVIEPSAGVPVAVALSEEFQQKYTPQNGIRNVGIVMTGGNVDIVKFASFISQHHLPST